MSLNLKYAIEASVFWPPADRVVPAGYKPAIDGSKLYDMVKAVPGVSGVELYYPYDFEDASAMGSMLDGLGLGVSAVGIGNFAGAEWQKGGVTAQDNVMRQKALDLAYRTIDAADALKAPVVVFWPAHDGYDYFFQADYGRKYDMLLDALQKMGAHNPAIKVGIEYKPREPRFRQFVPSAARALALAKECGQGNVGVIMDIGHSILAGENPAEEAAYLIRANRLVHLHSNDNYGQWDYDMVPGSVHFWEQIELFHWLDTLGYNGWMNFDICPFREPSAKACEVSIKNTQRMVDFALGMDYGRLSQIKDDEDAMAAQEYLWNELFKQKA